MSETPRTDAKERETGYSPIDTHAHYGWKMARTLERELNAVTAERDALRPALDRLLDLTKARMRNLEASPNWPQLDHIKEVRDAIDTAHDVLYGKEGA